MRRSSRLECIYLSNTWGLHDQRWCKALESLGYSVIRELPTSDQANLPIITGPLTSIDPAILELDNPVIGLSWGFDLHDLEAANSTNWLPRLAGLIVDSAPTLEIALNSGMPAEKIAMIPWGIELDQFVPTRTGSRDAVLQPRLLTLRAHESLYRVDTVIRAVKLLHDERFAFELVIGNDGSLTDQLVKLVDELQIPHVSFIGKSAESDLPDLFDSADIYISAAETDGTSVTLIQAMSMKVPVVVSDSPGNVAIISPADTRGARGTLFSIGDPQSLAQAITSVWSEPSITQSKVDAAWEFVQNSADWNHNIKRLLPLL